MLLEAIAAAESSVLAAIARERAALRAGDGAAVRRSRLAEAAQLYLTAVRAARASLADIEAAVPQARQLLERRRHGFSSLLRIELAALAAVRAATGDTGAAPQVRAG